MKNEVKSGKVEESEEPEKTPFRWTLLQFALSLGLIALLGGKVFAQSCAMCYTTAAAGGTGIIHALKGGIVVLLVPPVLIFSGLIYLIIRWQSMNAN